MATYQVPGKHSKDVSTARTAHPAPHAGPVSASVMHLLEHSSDLSPQQAIQLQRTVGNHALVGLLSGNIQPKLTVGAAHDRYEQEADRVADQVMRAPGSQPAQVAGETGAVHRKRAGDEVQAKPLAETISRRSIQRQGETNGKPAQAADPLGSFPTGAGWDEQLAASRGGGNPLPGSLRAFMEPRFGADFSGVRLHRGGESNQLNRAISAQAFTHGNDIYLGNGAPAPGTTEGNRLLAHELTHTIQQGTVKGAPVQRITARDATNQVVPNNNSNPLSLPQTYTSDGNPSIQLDGHNGVVTAEAVGDMFGHTIVVSEWRDYSQRWPNNQHTYQMDLTVNPDTNELNIQVENISQNMGTLGLFRRQAKKRGWEVSKKNAEGALTEAYKIKAEKNKYRYKLLGRGFTLKKSINCAVFGEMILKAAGIKANSGLIFKTPKELASGRKLTSGRAANTARWKRPANLPELVGPQTQVPGLLRDVFTVQQYERLQELGDLQALINSLPAGDRQLKINKLKILLMDRESLMALADTLSMSVLNIEAVINALRLPDAAPAAAAPAQPAAPPPPPTVAEQKPQAVEAPANSPAAQPVAAPMVAAPTMPATVPVPPLLAGVFDGAQLAKLKAVQSLQAFVDSLPVGERMAKIKQLKSLAGNMEACEKLAEILRSAGSLVADEIMDLKFNMK